MIGGQEILDRSTGVQILVGWPSVTPKWSPDGEKCYQSYQSL